MQFIRGVYNIKPHHQKCVATIGNFDGVHLGHQLILQQLTQEANSLNLKSCVIIFEPQPKEFFSKAVSPTRIFSLREKIHLLSKYKVDQILCLHFNEELRKLTADTFVKKILVAGLAVDSVYVGSDFKYGNSRLGDWKHLHSYAQEFGFKLYRTDKLTKYGETVSSTLIRQLLASGNIPVANKFLGQSFIIIGKIIHGRKHGREIGFPTANIGLNRRNLPINGVFAVVVKLGQTNYTGVANVGRRPSIKCDLQLLEVHIIDFNANIYGKVLKIEFIQKLREAKKFNSMALLQNEIKQDIKSAQQIFNKVTLLS